MPEPRPVLLVWVDLRGFKRYTLGSRTAALHGRGILGDLVGALKARLAGPLELVREDREGLFLLVDPLPDEATSDARPPLLAQLLALLEAFTLAQGHLMAANGCRCEACQAVGRIRLKLFVHAGEALVRRNGGRPEVSGADVNLAHRIREKDLHAESHLLLSLPAWEALGRPEGLDRVALGGASAELPEGCLFTPEEAPGLPLASRWQRLKLMVRKACWELKVTPQDAKA